MKVTAFKEDTLIKTLKTRLFQQSHSHFKALTNKAQVVMLLQLPKKEIIPQTQIPIKTLNAQSRAPNTTPDSRNGLSLSK